MITDDLILENDLDVIDNNEFESDCGYEDDVNYVRKKKLREYMKQLRAKEDAKEKDCETWYVITFKDVHKCLQSRDIKACDYKFLLKQTLDQVQVNPEIPVRAVQDQLAK
ncbi:hypothetical protein Tco_1309410 [Tanacetum coccineum]